MYIYSEVRCKSWTTLQLHSKYVAALWQPRAQIPVSFSRQRNYGFLPLTEEKILLQNQRMRLCEQLLLLSSAIATWVPWKSPSRHGFFSLQAFVWKSSIKQMYPVFSSRMKNFLRILLISPLAPSSIIVISSKPPKSLTQANVLQIINIWLHASNARSPENFSDGFKQTPVLSQLNTNEEY